MRATLPIGRAYTADIPSEQKRNPAHTIYVRGFSMMEN